MRQAHGGFSGELFPELCNEPRSLQTTVINMLNTFMTQPSITENPERFMICCYPAVTVRAVRVAGVAEEHHDFVGQGQCSEREPCFLTAVTTAGHRNYLHPDEGDEDTP